MKFQTVLMLVLTIGLLAPGNTLLAQTEEPAPEGMDPFVEPNLAYDDYTVKSYSITFFGGSFSGATYLDLQELGPRTVLTDDAYFLLGYNGDNLYETRVVDRNLNDAARKEIESGPAYGGKIGIYISPYFHLDMTGMYGSGKAVTSMLYRESQEAEWSTAVRQVVDEDDGFKVFKGGLGLAYDAVPAKFLGLVPQLGFGLGGIINRYSQLPDKTALYMEASLGLKYQVFDNWDLGAGADVTTFAYQVDELGYSNMVNYTTFSLGVTWHIGVVPDETRAAWEAEQSKKHRRR